MKTNIRLLCEKAYIAGSKIMPKTEHTTKMIAVIPNNCIGDVFGTIISMIRLITKARNDVAKQAIA